MPFTPSRAGVAVCVRVCACVCVCGCMCAWNHCGRSRKTRQSKEDCERLTRAVKAQQAVAASHASAVLGVGDFFSTPAQFLCRQLLAIVTACGAVASSQATRRRVSSSRQGGPASDADLDAYVVGVAMCLCVNAVVHGAGAHAAVRAWLRVVHSPYHSYDACHACLVAALDALAGIATQDAEALVLTVEAAPGFLQSGAAATSASLHVVDTSLFAILDSVLRNTECPCGRYPATLAGLRLVHGIMTHVVRRRIILDIRDIFNALDEDGNDSVSHEEFRSGMLRMGFKLSDRAMAQLMHMLDADGSGEIECVLATCGCVAVWLWLWLCACRPSRTCIGIPSRYREFVTFAQSQSQAETPVQTPTSDPSPFAVASSDMGAVGNSGTDQVSAELRMFLRHISQRTRDRHTKYVCACVCGCVCVCVAVCVWLWLCVAACPLARLVAAAAAAARC